MVTAPLQVWETYIQVMWLSSCVSFLITISYAQSHSKAKKFMTKAFPLYDDMAELCDAVITKGAGAFRGTGNVSTLNFGEGSEEDEEDLYEVQAIHGKQPISHKRAVSEDWDIEEPMVRHLGCCLNHWPLLTHAILFQTSVGMTPTLQKSAPGKLRAPDMPCDSGRLPDKCPC